MPVVDGFSVRDWQQFGRVDIDSTSRLTILTGANGSGKTTLLRLLGRHMEWNYPSLGVPTKTPDSGEAHYVVWPPETLVEEPPPRGRPGASRPNERRVGEVRMAGGERTTVFAPRGTVPTQYVLRVDPNVRIEGVFIPSHQPEFIYRPVENVPVQPRATSQVFSMVNGELRSRSLGGGDHNRTPFFLIKENLLAWALFGPGNENVSPNPEFRRLFSGFQTLLKKMLPRELGFLKLRVRSGNDVVLETETGEFLLDAVSGGVGALIVLAWQIYTYSSTLDPNRSYMVVIDEPENHLHPQMQQNLLPSLLSAFPTARFIIATHSPLIVSSEETAKVFVLTFGSSHRVNSLSLDIKNWNGSASEVLQKALGVSYTHPAWVQRKLESALSEAADGTSIEVAAERLKQRLEREGLTEWIPEGLLAMLRRRSEGE